MAAEKTYLELSEAGGGSHKFYEVVVDGKSVTVRFGRIGDAGQSKTEKFPTPEKATADAEKKLADKQKKGYKKAVMGARKKRAITRRQVASTPSKSKPSPVLWKFDTGEQAFGIFIDEKQCWAGNEDGRVFALSHEGKVNLQYKLPEGVMCIVGDGDFRYIGCNDGNVYDLTGKTPRRSYTLEEGVEIFWIDIADGLLGISDEDGNVMGVNYDDEKEWQKKSKGDSGWMVRCDNLGRVFHGHSKGITAYSALDSGKELWNVKTDGSVLFGWQESETLYAATDNDVVQSFTKAGKFLKSYLCDDSVMSCAASPNGKYVFAGDSASSLYCFNQQGERLWKLGTDCASALSMQYFNEKLYIVTSTGIFACIDVSEKAIEQAQQGTLPKTKDIAAPKPVKEIASDKLETVKSAGKGVTVECVKVNDKLRVRAMADGFNKKWYVQFPTNLRVEGNKYVVEELRESARGGFYRAFGEIKKLG